MEPTGFSFSGIASIAGAFARGLRSGSSPPYVEGHDHGVADGQGS